MCTAHLCLAQHCTVIDCATAIRHRERNDLHRGYAQHRLHAPIQDSDDWSGAEVRDERQEREGASMHSYDVRWNLNYIQPVATFMQQQLNNLSD